MQSTTPIQASFSFSWLQLSRSKNRALAAGFSVVRGLAAAGAKPRWLALPVLRDEVKSRSAPNKFRSHLGDDSEEN
jgi:hypothetical protein